MRQEDDDENEPVDIILPKNLGGRPTALTPQVQDMICRFVRTGAHKAVAAVASGIQERTYFKWMKQGKEDPDSVYGKFRHAVLAAEAEAHVDATSRLYQAGQKSWMANVEWLKRRHRNSWKEVQKTEVKGELNVKQTAPKYDYSTLSDEDLAKLVEIEEKLKAKLPSGNADLAGGEEKDIGTLDVDES